MVDREGEPLSINGTDTVITVWVELYLVGMGIGRLNRGDNES